MSDAPFQILLVEDDPALQELIRTILSADGYEVTIAPHGESGLAAFERNQPDVVITDLLMKHMHGFEFLRLLRKSPHGHRVPIMVVSGQSYLPDKRKAFEMGADSFLGKPFRRHQLIEAVERLIHTVRVRFWGVRGSIAAPGPDTIRYGGNTPCVTIERGRDLLILDAGTGLRKLGICLQAEAKDRPRDLHMLITHTHWDHIQGFPFFVPAYVPTNRIDVHGPPSVEKPLARVLRGQMDPAYFPVALGDMAASITVHEIREPEFRVGPFTVQAMYVNHPGITMAYRIELDGTVITYATDTEPYRFLLTDRHEPDEELAEYGGRRDQELVRFVSDSDLYIADSQYSPEEYETKRGWGHTCYTDAVEVALAARAKRLVLFSHDPMHDDEMIDRKLERCRELAAAGDPKLEVHAAIEGQAIELRPASRE